MLIPRVARRPYRLIPSEFNPEFLKGLWPNNEGSGTHVQRVTSNSPPPYGKGAGTFVGTPTWFADGERGYVLKFSSTGNYVECADQSFFNFASTSMSYTVWAKYGAGFNGGGSFPGIVTKAPSIENAGGYAINVRTDGGNNGRPYAIVGDGTQNNNATWGTSMADDKWHLLAAVVDRVAPALLKLSVDGAAFVTASLAAVGSSDTTGALRFGVRPDSSGPDNYFNGFIGEVRIYNRVITLAEIGALYRAGRHQTVVLPRKYLLGFLEPPIGGGGGGSVQSTVSIM